jgi:anti-sigma factor RsiW
MECPVKEHEKTDLLLDYCADRLDPRTSALLESHIASCPDCCAWIEAQRSVWAALDTWEAPPVSPGFDRALYQRIAAEESRMPWWQAALRPLLVWKLRPALSMALASLLVLAAFLMQIPRPPAPPQPGAVHVEAFDADRLEKALDDVELLRQLDAPANPDARSM